MTQGMLKFVSQICMTLGALIGFMFMVLPSFPERWFMFPVICLAYGLFLRIQAGELQK